MLSPRIVASLTDLAGNEKPVPVMGYEMPETFKAFFLIEDDLSGRCWSLEILVKIGEEGTPQVLEVITRGLSDQREFRSTGISDWISEMPREGVTRQQLATVENWFTKFLSASVEIALQIHTYQGDGTKHSWTVSGGSRVLEIKELKSFGDEMRIRIGRTKRTPEFLKEVARIYKSELTRSSKAGDRPKPKERVAEEFFAGGKTAESWIALARKTGFLEPAPKRKKSATKRRAVTTKQGKEKNGKTKVG